MEVVVRADGAYYHIDGRWLPLPGVHRVTTNGGLVIRIPARDVTIDVPVTTGQHLDCSDLQKCILAVVLCGISLAEIQAIRPTMAAAVQAYMTQHGLAANGAD